MPLQATAVAKLLMTMITEMFQWCQTTIGLQMSFDTTEFSVKRMNLVGTLLVNRFFDRTKCGCQERDWQLSAITAGLVSVREDGKTRFFFSRQQSQHCGRLNVHPSVVVPSASAIFVDRFPFAAGRK